ncbi:hypothetical protein IU431_06660 [Nocardia otitidiscaviarum]|uniref:hypothetical protein n=1 Tax=Nocardia otitidiscaviarum TaxID=1823 RepID=UPI0004A6B033|nr:hypothetical protein [Nocardia otitidiscaviarum]MBF6483838.1 hypothetical protein [Nocardia otitidiscaviarum]
MPGETPIYHWPYPVATDPIYQGAQQMQNLATAIEATFNAATVPPGASPPPTASAIRTAGLSVNNSADTVVSWQAAEWDSQPGGQAQYSTTGLTCRVAGLYLIEAVWTWAGNSNGRRSLKVTKNSTASSGAILADAESANAWDNIGMASGVRRLAVGDVLRLIVAQDSGGTLTGGQTMFADVRGRLTMTYQRAVP